MSERRVAIAVRYTKLTQIGVGEGRNSRVFCAWDKQRAEEIIVKEIDISTFAGDVDRYFDESNAICAASNARVVPLFYAGKNKTHVSLAMPRMAGSLAGRICDLPLTARETIAIGRDICAGAEAVHKASRLHLDLKPTNVLFDSSGRAMVADFGQSLPLDSLGVGSGSARIYLTYYPPEMLSGGELTILSDIYQIGLTLYRAVNGDGWFSAQLAQIDDDELDGAIRDGDFPDRRAFLPHVPHSLRRVIVQALEVDPADRYESAVEVAEALGKVAIPHNWLVTDCDCDALSWRLEESGRADVIVNAVAESGRWRVEVWTQKSGEPARKRRSSGPDRLWRTGLNWRNASTLLTRAFRQLP